MNIEIKVPDGISGDWEVSTFTVQASELSQRISKLQTGRGVPEGTYKRLTRCGEVIVSNTPDEIWDFSMFLRYRATGKVLINGLGLGVLVQGLLEKPDITEITIIEKSEDVIKLSGPTYLKDERVNIIHADAFEYKPPKGKLYDAVWHDIWDYITSENIPEMKKLHRKYGRFAKYQESWCRKVCETIRKREKNSWF